jgi:hypothetical protein
MRLITLAGLVSVEKSDLTIGLAQHFAQAGQSVTVLDNISRLPMDTTYLWQVDYVRLGGDLSVELPPVLEQIDSEVVLLGASETLPPDDLIVLLDGLQGQYLRKQTIALIDTRTCDCFPQVRETLEAHADIIINLPVEFSEMLALL